MQAIKGIKNIILDFGGVLYDIEPNRTILAFKQLSTNIDLQFDIEYLYSNYINPYEKGVITSKEFRVSMMSNLALDIDDLNFDKAWNATLIGIFEDSINAVTKLKEKFNVILLSNTNQIHFDYFSRDCGSLFSLFDNCYFSHQIGFVKPEPDCFNYVLNKMNYKPEESLFVDDSQLNITAAATIGLNTFIINGRKKMSDLLHSVL
jgi:glucose-1-phosphatase